MNSRSRSTVMCVALLASVSTALAQIPNGDFETWGGGAPVGWSVSPFNVTQSSDAHSGSSAVSGSVIQLVPGTNLEPVIQTGADGRGFAYAQRPGQISGWYKFSPLQGDRFGVNAWLFKGGIDGTRVAYAAAADSTVRSAYSQFTIPFTYFTGDTPDTCIIQILIAAPASGPTNGWHVGSSFIVDDLSLSGTASVAEKPQLPAEFRLDQNYPNPFNPTTTIGYTVGGVRNQDPGSGEVRLAVYDLLGREVAVLVHERQAPGRYEVRFDAGAFASGVYYYRLTAGPYSATKTLTLVR